MADNKDKVESSQTTTPPPVYGEWPAFIVPKNIYEFKPKIKAKRRRASRAV